MAETTSLFYTKLPREVRDEVYRFMFDGDEGAPFKIIPLSQWIEKDRMDRRVSINYTVTPVPTCPIYKFIISRQFFQEACAAWLRFHSIECHHDFHDIVTASPILQNFLTRLTSTWQRLNTWHVNFRVLNECTKLRELRLHVSDCMFDPIANKMCFRDSFEEGDYRSLWKLEQLLAIPTLETVKLLPMKSGLAKTDEEKEIWGRNVVVLEAFINRTVKGLRKAEKEGEEKDPLKKAADRLTRPPAGFMPPALQWSSPLPGPSPFSGLSSASGPPLMPELLPISGLTSMFEPYSIPPFPSTSPIPSGLAHPLIPTKPSVTAPLPISGLPPMPGLSSMFGPYSEQPPSSALAPPSMPAPLPMRARPPIPAPAPTAVPSSIPRLPSKPAPAPVQVPTRQPTATIPPVQESASSTTPPLTLTKRTHVKVHPSPSKEDVKATTSSVSGAPTVAAKKPNKPLHSSHRLSLARFYANYPLIAALAIAGLTLTVINTFILLLLVCESGL